MPKREPAFLRSFAREHLSYEVEMLFGSLRELSLMVEHRFEPKDTTSKIVHDALLCAVVVHCRVLNDFLMQTRPLKSDDILAADYCEHWSPVAVLAPAEVRRINKFVMHPSGSRRIGGTYVVSGYVSAIARRLAEFVDSVRPEYQDEMVRVRRALDQFEVPRVVTGS